MSKRCTGATSMDWSTFSARIVAGAFRCNRTDATCSSSLELETDSWSTTVGTPALSLRKPKCCERSRILQGRHEAARNHNYALHTDAAFGRAGERDRWAANPAGCATRSYDETDG